MSKQQHQMNQMKNATKYIVAGMVIGSAVGTAVSVMTRPKAQHTMRTKTASALETVGAIMQNVADFTR